MNRTVKQNFEIMSDRLAEYMQGIDGKKATIIFITDFGGYSVLPVRLHSVRFAPYAQYSEAMRVVFTPKGKRNKRGLVLYSGKTFAIFADWVTASASIGETIRTASGTVCRVWSACDRNEFYKLVDSTQGEKLAEQSERLYLDEIKQHSKKYCVYGVGFSETYDTEAELLAKYEKVGEISNGYNRAELQGTPRLKGLCGAMWDGYDDDGRACIRYETPELCDILSN